MRKWIALAFLVSFAAILIIQDLNITKDHPSRLEAKEEEYNPSLELLYHGKMDEIEFGITTDSINIIERWGEPNQKTNFMGGLLLIYDDIYFFTDGLITNEGINYGKVTGIYYTGEKVIYEIQNGMPQEQVEEILGSPNSTYISHYSELYIDNNSIIRYSAGEYEVNFEIAAESKKVHSISIWHIEK